MPLAYGGSGLQQANPRYEPEVSLPSRKSLCLGGDLNELSDECPKWHAEACWPRMGARPSLEARPADRRRCLRRGAGFGTRTGLAGSPAIVRATSS
jgi:hypothetical protein